MNCYEMKNCCFNGTNPQGSKCPPHQMQIGCWEYDWLSFYTIMLECEEKYKWRDIMLEKCPECVVYCLHKHEIDRILEGLKNSQ
ncbi:MAG TPA: hypothetical protein VEB00_10765 [Clostridia bacterium]|nr:hypothetical protein [Clostridia bacterium]